MTITFTPTITTAGQAAAISASSNGLQLSLTAISFGTGSYTPTGTETALVNQVKSVTLASGGLVGTNQLRMSAVWASDTDASPIYEVGFWAGTTLFAVWSAGGGSASPLGYKSAGIDFVLYNDLYFSQLPASSVTIQVDSGQSAVLAALGAHEVAANAHPQYALIADFIDVQSGLWCGLAGGTANNIILTLPASQTAVSAYAAGQRYVFKAAYANTGAVTAQVKLTNGTTLTAQSVTKSGTTALNAGDVVQYAIYELIYDGLNSAQFQISGGAGGAATRSDVEYVITGTQATTNKTATLSLAVPYTVGMLDVFMQGRRLAVSDYTATDGANVVFPIGTFSGGESVQMLGWSSYTVVNAAAFRVPVEFTLTANQASITTPYTPGCIEVAIDGAGLTSQDYTATDGATIVFTDPSKIIAGAVCRVQVFKPYAVANALPLAGGTMSGPIAMFGGDTTPSPSPLSNNTQVANTAFANSTGAAVGTTRNLKAYLSAAATSVAFTADEVIVETALGGAPYRIGSFSATLNTTTTGANGMDSGTAAPTSGYLAIYAIFNPTTKTAALLGYNATSAKVPEIYGGSNMPSGYTASALISVWPTNSSGLLVVGAQRERYIGVAAATVFSQVATYATPTLVTISAIPKNAVLCSGFINIQTPTAAYTTVSISSDANNVNQKAAVSQSSTNFLVPFENLIILTPQTVYVSSQVTAPTSASAATLLGISGYAI
jgi:hypothetical protein